MAPASVRVRLYATARAAVGRPFVDLPVPRDGIRVRELLGVLADRWPPLAPILRASRFVRNDAYVSDLGTRLEPGDEFAVHPPYGGG